MVFILNLSITQLSRPILHGRFKAWVAKIYYSMKLQNSRCAGSEKIENADPGLKFQISRVRVLTFENRGSGSGSKVVKTRGSGSGSNVKNSKFYLVYFLIMPINDFYREMLFDNWENFPYSNLCVSQNNSGFSSIKNSKKCVSNSQNNSAFKSIKNSLKSPIKKSE